jgi:hypothetical protein
MTARTLPLVAAAAFAVMLVSGCGSSSSSTNSSSTSATALTKPEFIAKADAICKQGNQVINAAGNKIFSGGKPSKSQVTQFVTATIIPSIQTEVDSIKALTPPAGDSDQINQLLTDVQSSIDKAKQNPELLASKNSSVFAQANKEAKAYGLKVCGS